MRAIVGHRLEDSYHKALSSAFGYAPSTRAFQVSPVHPLSTNSFFVNTFDPESTPGDVVRQGPQPSRRTSDVACGWRRGLSSFRGR